MEDVRTQMERALSNRDSASVVALLRAAPPFSMQPTALQLASMGNVGMMMTGVDQAVMAYALQGPYEWAVELGSGLWDVAAPLLVSGAPDREVVLLPALRTVDNLVAALGRLGRWQESAQLAKGAVDVLQRYAPQLQRVEAGMDILHGTGLKIVEAELELGQLESAEHRLLALEAVSDMSPVQGMERTRLRRRLDVVLESVNRLPHAPRNEADNAADYEQTMRDAIAALGNVAGQGVGNVAALLGARLGAESQPTLADADVVDRAGGLADRLLEHFAGSGDAEMFQVQKQIRDATSIFVDPQRGTSPPDIARSRDSLYGALQWCDQRGHVSDANNCRWGLYLCHNRLARHDASADAATEHGHAADRLIELRGSLEQVRALIADRERRAGIFGEYTHLFPALVASLYGALRWPEMLDAIEGSKGRYLEDLLDDTGAIGRARSAASELPQLLAPTRAAYVSYFLDDDETFAIAVEPDGRLTPARIPVTKAAVHDAARRADPESWGAIDDPFAAPAPTPVDLLSPLTAWLGDVVARAGHLCISPDDALHLVPFHYLHVGSEPLGARISVSRAHGAGVLAALLRRPSFIPTDWTTVVVPARSDSPEAQQDLGRIAARAGGPDLGGADANLDGVVRLPLEKRRVHFGTHGFFPLEGAGLDLNPHDGAGLLLADATGYADLDPASTRLPQQMLTPRQIGAKELNFTQSVVALQSCVTGMAREGVGGDALGLELALFRAGASTVVASHWNVSMRSSSAFFSAFYDALDAGRSRAEAWRMAVDACRASAGDGPEGLREWAAFSLGGDWR